MLYHESFAADARQVRRLLSLGFIDIDGRNNQVASKYGVSPLHNAALYGHGKAVKVLLENGAEPNKTNRKGWTPLHMAAECGFKSVSMVRMLLDWGADPRKEDKDGDTPMSVAAKNGHREVLALLRGLRPRRRRDVP